MTFRILSEAGRGRLVRANPATQNSRTSRPRSLHPAALVFPLSPGIRLGMLKSQSVLLAPFDHSARRQQRLLGQEATAFLCVWPRENGANGVSLPRTRSRKNWNQPKIDGGISDA